MADNDKVTIYEVGFHIATTMPEEKLPEQFGAIKAFIEGLGAEFIAEEFPKRIALAYTIEKKTQSGTIKHNDAYFGWIKFALSSEKIADLKSNLDSDDNIVRFIIVKTVRENTIPVKTFNAKRSEDEADGEAKEEITEEDEKKIDESIEELVIE